jgi:Mg-chelatase subunit ChlD
LLDKITRARASKETDIAKTIHKSIELFPNKVATKHLVLMTDAMPTVGDDPRKETLEACSMAKNKGITISLIGIKLDKKGESLAKDIVSLGEGRFYVVRDLEEIDKVVLEDYYSVL